MAEFVNVQDSNKENHEGDNSYIAGGKPVGTSDHDKEMINKVEGKQEELPKEDPKGEPEEKEEKKYADRFESVEALEKAYKELQSKFTKEKQGEHKEDPKEDPKEDLKEDDKEKDAKETVENLGFDWDALNNEYLAQGKLSDKTLENLENKGIPKDIVNAYIQGQEARAAQFENTIFQTVNGEDNYKAMAEWAAENVPEEELVEFNNNLNTSTEKAVEATRNLFQRYVEAEGLAPESLIQGETTGVSTEGSFQSWAQVKEAMNDPKYSKDPAYRKSIERKLARSNL